MTLTHALHLAGQGFKVFPLRPNTKRPSVKDWPHKATSDATMVTYWWTENPEYNIGVATGSNLVVLDIDRKNDVDGYNTLGVLIDLLPPTLTVTTPSGGSHLYFTTDTPLKNSAGQLGPGLDIRGEGGFVVGPGSTIDGKAYTVSSPADRLAAFPTFLANEISRGKPSAADRPLVRASVAVALDTAQALSQATHYAQTVDPAIEGNGGDAHTYAVAAKVLDFGLSPPIALDILAEHFNPRCEPPWDIPDLKTKLDNALKYRTSPPGISSPQAEFTAVEPTRPRIYFELYQDIKPDLTANPLIENYLDRNTFSVLYGESHVGKTFVALDMAFAISTGRPFAGQTSHPGAVIYVASEGGRGIHKRIEALKRAHNTPKAALAVVPCAVRLLGAKNDTAELISAVDRAAAALKGAPAMVVIDTLSRAMSGANENDSADMTAFISAVDRIRTATGAHVMVVHHAGKDTTKGARGHSSLRAATDTELEIEAHTLIVRKQRDGEHAPERRFRLTTVEVGQRAGAPVTSCVVAWEGPGDDFSEIQLTPDEAEILDALKKALEGSAGTSVAAPAVLNAVVDITGRGASISTVKRTLRTLADKGVVRQSGDRKGRKWAVV